jgi:hypothetical protein
VERYIRTLVQVVVRERIGLSFRPESFELWGPQSNGSVGGQEDSAAP